jgi:hypothetical protein
MCHNYCYKSLKVLEVVKTYLLNSHLFTTPCEECRQIRDLLLQEIRQLSSSKVSDKWVERKSNAEVYVGLLLSICLYFWNKKWLCLLLYLSFIFCKLYWPVTSLQGSSADIFRVFKVSEFIRKMTVLKDCERDNVEMFVSMCEDLQEK